VNELKTMEVQGDSPFNVISFIQISNRHSDNSISMLSCRCSLNHHRFRVVIYQNNIELINIQDL
jgi:hypothetical protein